MKLKSSELRALSNVCANFSEVFLASLVVPAFVGTFDTSRVIVLILGLALASFFVWLSLIFAKKGRL